MSVTDKNMLKSWFVRHAKPLASQFAAWLDSYWHKDESIPVDKIDQLDSILAGKIDRAEIENIVNEIMLERRIQSKVYTTTEEIFVAEPMTIYRVDTKNIASIEINGVAVDLTPVDGYEDISTAKIEISPPLYSIISVVVEKQYTDPSAHFYLFSKVKV